MVREGEGNQRACEDRARIKEGHALQMLYPLVLCTLVFFSFPTTSDVFHTGYNDTCMRNKKFMLSFYQMLTRTKNFGRIWKYVNLGITLNLWLPLNGLSCFYNVSGYVNTINVLFLNVSNLGIWTESNKLFYIKPQCQANYFDKINSYSVYLLNQDWLVLLKVTWPSQLG